MYQKVKGFRDIYGEEAQIWGKVEEAFKKTFANFGYSEFKLPILEKSEVFNKGIGSTTDIVEKEMFTFEDRDGTQVSLRPEGTASLVRSYIENKLYNPPGVAKYYYIGPMFRRERPQKGRFRQFFQAGVEVFGAKSPVIDADVIYLLFELSKAAGIQDSVVMEINSIGCPECRPAYNEKLIAFFKQNSEKLCEDCHRRLERNPMRILDCKSSSCKEVTAQAPVMLDDLCDDCVNHFEYVKKYLNALKVPYNINPMMVRGLDYYVRTAFELVTNKLGSQNAVGAGGRYDGLIKLLGGPDTPGIGFAIGIDRMVSLAMMNQEADMSECDVFIIAFKDESDIKAVELMKEFRSKNIRAEVDYDFKAMKKQFARADKTKAAFTIILGSQEIEKGEAAVKDMRTGEQVLVPFEGIAEYITKNLQAF